MWLTCHLDWTGLWNNFFAPSRSQIFAPVKAGDKSGCVPAQTRWTLPPLLIYFCSSEQGKGKNCKIRQEFCLWGARTQLPVGAGNGRECHKKSCNLWHFQMVNTLVCSHMYIDCQIQKHRYRCIPRLINAIKHIDAHPLAALVMTSGLRFYSSLRQCCT